MIDFESLEKKKVGSQRITVESDIFFMTLAFGSNWLGDINWSISQVMSR
jgi:hypothetical protein